MILYASPYDTGMRLGRAYNATMALLGDDDCACLVDADALFTTPHFGAQIERVVAAHPECGLFYALANRIGCPWQRDATVGDSDDMRLHRAHGAELARRHDIAVRDVRGEAVPASGFLILLRKRLWTRLGGFREEGMLGVDNDFFVRARDRGEPILQMLGVYLYHWYRGGNVGDFAHLVAPPLAAAPPPPARAGWSWPAAE